MKIYYQEGFKYQLRRKVKVKTKIKGYRVSGRFFYYLYPDGTLIIQRGYAWDGPSGPTIDTPDSLPASLVHDVFYEMMRKGLLPRKLRKEVDYDFYKRLIKDGMHWARATVWQTAVRLGAKGASLPKNLKKVLVAP